MLTQSGPFGYAPSPAPSLGSQACVKVAALTAGFGLGAQAQELTDVLMAMLGAHAGRGLDLPPAWPSDICDDHGPFEFSVAMTRRSCALRVLVETGAPTGALGERQRSAEATTELLAARYGVPLTGLSSIAELFGGEHADQFARWHAVGFEHGRPVNVKVYLNPQARGRDRAPMVVREALQRLGFADAWDELAPALARGEADELKYVGLDLTADPGARVKVYVRHHAISGNELETALSQCRGYRKDEAREFCELMTQRAGRYDALPIITCYAWTSQARGCASTLHVPIRAYAPDDLVAYERILGYLQQQGIDSAGYARALPAFAMRPLDAGVGIQSYASIKGTADGNAVTVYLVPESYSVQPSRARDTRVTPTSSREIEHP